MLDFFVLRLRSAEPLVRLLAILVLLVEADWVEQNLAFLEQAFLEQVAWAIALRESYLAGAIVRVPILKSVALKVARSQVLNSLVVPRCPLVVVERMIDKT